MGTASHCWRWLRNTLSSSPSPHRCSGAVGKLAAAPRGSVNHSESQGQGHQRAALAFFKGLLTSLRGPPSGDRRLGRLLAPCHAALRSSLGVACVCWSPPGIAHGSREGSRPLPGAFSPFTGIRRPVRSTRTHREGFREMGAGIDIRCPGQTGEQMPSCVSQSLSPTQLLPQVTSGSHSTSNRQTWLQHSQ